MLNVTIHAINHANPLLCHFVYCNTMDEIRVDHYQLSKLSCMSSKSSLAIRIIDDNPSSLLLPAINGSSMLVLVSTTASSSPWSLLAVHSPKRPAVILQILQICQTEEIRQSPGTSLIPTAHFRRNALTVQD